MLRLYEMENATCSHPHRGVAVGVSLFDAPSGEGDLAMECGGEAEDDAALDLGRDCVGIDLLAAIDDGSDSAIVAASSTRSP